MGIPHVAGPEISKSHGERGRTADRNPPIAIRPMPGARVRVRGPHVQDDFVVSDHGMTGDPERLRKTQYSSSAT